MSSRITILLFRYVVPLSENQTSSAPGREEIICKTVMNLQIGSLTDTLSLVSRRGGGRGERAPGTHDLHMRLIITEFHGDHVHMYTGDVINWLR